MFTDCFAEWDIRAITPKWSIDSFFPYAQLIQQKLLMTENIDKLSYVLCSFGFDDDRVMTLFYFCILLPTREMYPVA